LRHGSVSIIGNSECFPTHVCLSVTPARLHTYTHTQTRMHTCVHEHVSLLRVVLFKRHRYVHVGGMDQQTGHRHASTCAVYVCACTHAHAHAQIVINGIIYTDHVA
jgi:hypothetical protein